MDNGMASGNEVNFLLLMKCLGCVVKCDVYHVDCLKYYMYIRAMQFVQ